MLPNGLLTSADCPPFGVRRLSRQSPFVVLCDHAANAIPLSLGRLGLSLDTLNQHIALDIGALRVAKTLSYTLNAPLIFQKYSRLVIDCNRFPNTPESIPEKSDTWLIPGNQRLDPAEKNQRYQTIFLPYHTTIQRFLAQRSQTILISIHSFTPQLRLHPSRRPWDIGLLYLRENQFAGLFSSILHQTSYLIGDNQPYKMNDQGYTLMVHAENRNLLYVGLEIRQDILQSYSRHRAVTAVIADSLTHAFHRL